MAIKNLVRALILVSGLKGLPLGLFLERVLGLSSAATSNPTLVPDLDPTPAQIKTKADGIALLISERGALETLVEAKTVKINAGVRELTHLINNNWASQTEFAIAGDIEKAKLLGWNIKGVITGVAPARAVVGTAFDSYPAFSMIVTSNHLQHKVCTRNNLNGKVAMPKGVSRIEIYMQIGGLTPPTDISTMTDAGTASRGNLLINFDDADMGKIVYYIAVYIDIKTKKPLIQSPVMSATIR